MRKTLWLWGWGGLAGILMIAGCTTTKTYHVTSRPEGALVMIHEHQDPDGSGFLALHGNTPADPEIMYLGGDHYYVSIEKRGYERVTRLVNEQSDSTLEFDLTRIAGVDETTFNHEKLAEGRFFLLPVDMDVRIHSGVGALDKHEPSRSECQRVSETFDTRLRAWLTQNTSRIELEPALDPAMRQQWNRLAGALKTWITQIRAERIPYYSRPLMVNERVDGFAAFFNQLEASAPHQRKFLLYLRGCCISETMGRKFGNAILSPMATIKFGGPQPAFASDTGTTFFLYVIDAQTSELLLMEQYAFPLDATKDQALTALVEQIGNLPCIQPPQP